jgi:hypothetical protein
MPQRAAWPEAWKSRGCVSFSDIRVAVFSRWRATDYETQDFAAVIDSNIAPAR